MSDNSDNEAPAYEVGYKKPPLHGRIKPGEVRNPRGRRKGVRNLKTDLKEALDEPIVIKIGGAPKRITSQRALVKALIHGGLKGNHNAASKVLNLAVQLLGDDAPKVDMKALSAEDQALLHDYLKRKS